MFTFAPPPAAKPIAPPVAKPIAPPALTCPAETVFTPFSLVPPSLLPSGAKPIAGRIVRLDFCSDDANGTLLFQRLVSREMKVQGTREVPYYSIATEIPGQPPRGLAEAAFNDTRALLAVLRTDAGEAVRLVGSADGATLTFETGTFAAGAFTRTPDTVPAIATLEQEDRIALSEGSCGADEQLERAVFRAGSFSLESEACRVTRPSGARYTFRKLVVEDAPNAKVTLASAAELARFAYAHSHHNAADGWTLTSGDVTYEFVTTDDIEEVGGEPTEVKFFRTKRGNRTLRELRIVAPACLPLSCDWKETEHE